jgi:hypothetical protein
LQFYIILALLSSTVDALVMVIDGDRQNFLGPVLANNPLIQLLIDLLGGRNSIELEFGGGRGGVIFLKDVSTQINALVADENVIGSGNQPIDFFLGALAK